MHAPLEYVYPMKKSNHIARATYLTRYPLKSFESSTNVSWKGKDRGHKGAAANTTHWTVEPATAWVHTIVQSPSPNKWGEPAASYR